MNNSSRNKYSEQARKIIIKSFPHNRAYIDVNDNNFNVIRLINKSVKVGDIVLLHDGSSLSLKSE